MGDEVIRGAFLGLIINVNFNQEMYIKHISNHFINLSHLCSTLNSRLDFEKTFCASGKETQ